MTQRQAGRRVDRQVDMQADKGVEKLNSEKKREREEALGKLILEGVGKGSGCESARREESCVIGWGQYLTFSCWF